jgi:predicted PurR-regulated permease PerM
MSPVRRSPADAVPYQLQVAAAIAWRFLVVAAAVAVVALALARLIVVVLPVVLALFLAAVLDPPARWLRRRRFPPALAALSLVAASILLVAAVVAVVAPRAADDVGALGANVEAGIETVTTWLLEGPLEVSEDELERWQERGVDELRSRTGTIAGGALGGAYLVVELVAGLLLAVVVLFFFLKDGDRIWPWVVRLFPERARRDVDEVGRIAWRTLGRYLRGVSVVAFVDAVFIGLALWLIGVPLVVPLALLTFVGGFFPLVGAITAGAAAALVALVTGGVVDALLVVAAAILVQQLEGNLLQPFIVGRAVRLHPVAVILAVAVGAVVWGIPGAFLAVPVAAVASQAASHLRSAGRAAGPAAEAAGP